VVSRESIKGQEIVKSQAWWYTPVILATQVADIRVGHQWLTSVNLVTQEAEIRRTSAGG
jgi:hypothetical protein